MAILMLLCFIEFRTNIANNFSTSVIPIIAQRSDYITGARYTLPIIPWELDLSEEDEESESNNGFGNDKGANVGEEGEDEEVASEGSVGDVSDRSLRSFLQLKH